MASVVMLVQLNRSMSPTKLAVTTGQQTVSTGPSEAARALLLLAVVARGVERPAQCRYN